MLKKIRSEKGFTLIEVIVVVAIIAIMSAVMMLVISNQSTIRAAADEKAETFYYSLQRAASNAKSVDTDFPSGCDHILVCVTIDADGKATDLSFAKINGATVTDPSSNNLVASDLSVIASGIDNVFESYNEATCFYGLIDSNFRVEKAFQTNCTYADAKGAGFAISDNLIGGALVGSYPNSATSMK